MEFHLQSELMKTALKSGILGVVLAWALWQNSQITERLFIVVQNNTAAIESFKQALGR